MRMQLNNSGPQFIGKIPEGFGVLIQVIDPINVWFSTKRSDLDQVDNANVPQAGIMQTSFNPPDFRTLPFFADELWARTNSSGKIEVIIFKCYTPKGE